MLRYTIRVLAFVLVLVPTIVYGGVYETNPRAIRAQAAAETTVRYSSQGSTDTTTAVEQTSASPVDEFFILVPLTSYHSLRQSTYNGDNYGLGMGMVLDWETPNWAGGERVWYSVWAAVYYDSFYQQAFTAGVSIMYRITPAFSLGVSAVVFDKGSDFQGARHRGIGATIEAEYRYNDFAVNLKVIPGVGKNPQGQKRAWVGTISLVYYIDAGGPEPQALSVQYQEDMLGYPSGGRVLGSF